MAHCSAADPKPERRQSLNQASLDLTENVQWVELSGDLLHFLFHFHFCYICIYVCLTFTSCFQWFVKYLTRAHIKVTAVLVVIVTKVFEVS